MDDKSRRLAIVSCERSRTATGGWLDLQQPSPNCNNYGMGSVIGLEFVDQIPDVEIDRGF
jgi:hypothetical protein